MTASASPVSSTTDGVIVKFKANASQAAIDALNASMATQQVDAIPALGLRVLRIAPGQDAATVAARYEKNPLVQFAEPDALVLPEALPNDQKYGQQWHLTKIGAPAAWDETKAVGVLVAICDTGVANVADLSASLRTDLGWNAVDGSTNWADAHGHGTAVAGTAAATSNNIEGVSGVAWGAQIIPVRISNTADGAAYASDAADCIRYATDKGARAINVSYLMADSAAIDTAGQYARERGAIVIVAAGNNAQDPGWVNHPNFIAVSATTSTDALASFSNFGTFVDVAAPGASILTTNRSGGYGTFFGTSFASPVVAGVTALVFSASPSLTAAQAESILLGTADDLGPGGYDTKFGNGRINAARAVATAMGSTPSATATPSPTSTPISATPTPVPAAPTPTATVEPGDLLAPQVVLSGLTASSALRGTVTIIATASDNVAVSRVDFYVDGVLLRADTGAPYTTSWNTRKVSNGSHTVTAVAWDAAGNSATDSRTATVAN